MAAHERGEHPQSAPSPWGPLARNPDWQDRLREEISQTIIEPAWGLCRWTQLDCLRLNGDGIQGGAADYPPGSGLCHDG